MASDPTDATESTRPDGPVIPHAREPIDDLRIHSEDLDEPMAPVNDDVEDGEGGALNVPPVVAVVVTNEPGEWFEEALAALGEQDYPSLSVLVVDSGSRVDPTARVAAVLPHAYVRRLPENVGFAAAANEVLQIVEGASHFLFCHDDVAPAPDAVRLLVEEAYRSNAGIVSPKFVDWDDPRRLLQVGMGVDKSGAPDSTVEPGELDQEQHDAVKDVFVAPGGATLVRADLFAIMGGFDGAMKLFEEDLDLSWRAQIVGARVIVAPAAKVRHVQALSSGRRGIGSEAPPATTRQLRDRDRSLHSRHRLRTVLKVYGPWHSLRVVPQVALLAVLEVIVGVLTGNRASAAATAGAWKWNLRRGKEIRAARKHLASIRSLPDSEVRRLHVRGSARARAVVRGQLIGTDTHEGPAARWLAAPDEMLSATGKAVRRRVGVGVTLGLLVIVGSRQLLADGIPAFGQLGALPEGPTELLRLFLSGWRSVGLGAEAPAPPAFGILGVLGIAFGGAFGLLRTVLILGCLPIGVIGARRAARPIGDRPAVAVAAVYLLLPVPYDAIARGRLGGLVGYAIAPWLLGSVARASGVAPFASPDEHRNPSAQRAAVLALGLGLALAAAFDPAIVVLPLILATALVLGGLLFGGVTGAGRAAARALSAVVVAAVLAFPWTLDFVLPGTKITSLLGVDVAPDRGLSMLDLVRFHSGPLGGGPLGFALPLAALLPLVVGSGWRLAWAARLWLIALVSWTVLWVGGRFGVPLPSAEMILALAGAALVMAIGLGLAAFETDLRAHRFGWRQTLSFGAAALVGLAALPVIGGAIGGRWGAPRESFNSALSWMPEQRRSGDFRVLWLGDPEALPVASWRVDEGLAYGTSRNGPATIADQWVTGTPGPAAQLADAVNLARRSRTTSLGRLLGPAAVRYIVVPDAVAPGLSKSRRLPPPAGLLSALAAQVDLRRLDSESGLVVYENSAFGPLRASVGEEVADSLRLPGVTAAHEIDVTGAKPVLTTGSTTSAGGQVPAGPLYLAEASSPRWELRVGGDVVPRERASWANLFDVASPGRASLRYLTSPARLLAVGLQLALIIGATVPVLSHRRAKSRNRRRKSEVHDREVPSREDRSAPAKISPFAPEDGGT